MDFDNDVMIVDSGNGRKERVSEINTMSHRNENNKKLVGVMSKAADLRMK